jgi:hypothetical protein
MKNSDIYVDHSLLIDKVNHLIDKDNNKLCVSRPRRFGKSTDANMLVAYYSLGCDSSSLFDDLKISQTKNYQKYLNKYNVIHLNMQQFLSKTKNIDGMISLLTRRLTKEIVKKFNTIDFFDINDLVLTLEDVYNETNNSFIFIIDEWDCIFRVYKEDKEAQERYLDFLRDLLKDQSYVSLAYMTGILPVKKYGTHSALNMFDEYSILYPKELACFMGFTEEEVKNLCEEHDMTFEEIKNWYNGYTVGDYQIYSPRSVNASLSHHSIENYWNDTETFKALSDYIDMDMDGLKQDVIDMIGGKRISIMTNTFQNDMVTFHSKDDVLTLLIHLGYLAYDAKEKEVYIPNKEVIEAFYTSIQTSDWGAVTKALNQSRDLIEATYRMEEEKVAKYIEDAHLETSILTYNSEEALSYTVLFAYYYARNDYTIIREMPTGKGYADIVFIPYTNKPAMIVELKWDKEVETAISQIKEKKYYYGLEKYLDNLLLVGITYDKKTKEHICKIEKY